MTVFKPVNLIILVSSILLLEKCENARFTNCVLLEYLMKLKIIYKVYWPYKLGRLYNNKQQISTKYDIAVARCDFTTNIIIVDNALGVYDYARVDIVDI